MESMWDYPCVYAFMARQPLCFTSLCLLCATCKLLQKQVNIARLQVKHICLSRKSSLESLLSLVTFRNITRLHISGISALTSVGAVSELHSLEDFRVRECPNLKCLDVNNKTIKRFDALGGDGHRQIVINLPNASEICFTWPIELPMCTTRMCIGETGPCVKVLRVMSVTNDYRGVFDALLNACPNLEYFGGANMEQQEQFQTLLSRKLDTLEFYDGADVFHLLDSILSDKKLLPSLSLSAIRTLNFLNADAYYIPYSAKFYPWHHLGKFNNLYKLMLPASLEVSAPMVDTLPSSIQEVVLWYRQRGAVEFFVNRYGLNLSVLIVADEPTPDMHTAVDAIAKEFCVEIEFKSYDRNEVLPCDE